MSLKPEEERCFRGAGVKGWEWRFNFRAWETIRGYFCARQAATHSRWVWVLPAPCATATGRAGHRQLQQLCSQERTEHHRFACVFSIPHTGGISMLHSRSWSQWCSGQAWGRHLWGRDFCLLHRFFFTPSCLALEDPFIRPTSYHQIFQYQPPLLPSYSVKALLFINSWTKPIFLSAFLPRVPVPRYLSLLLAEGSSCHHKGFLCTESFVCCFILSAAFPLSILPFNLPIIGLFVPDFP